jgi:hypothetical protein
MKIHGVHKVYYSDGEGNIVVQKVSDLDEEDCVFSKGLLNNREQLRHCRLPLSSKMKSSLMSGLEGW